MNIPTDIPPIIQAYMHTVCLIHLTRPDVDYRRTARAVQSFYYSIYALHPVEAEIDYEVAQKRCVAVDPRTSRRVLPLVRATVAGVTYRLDLDDLTFTTAKKAAHV